MYSFVGPSDLRLYHEQHRVAFAQRGKRCFHQPAVELIPRFMYSRGIHKDDLVALSGKYSENSVPGRLGLGRCYGNLLLQQLIEQSRLSDVRRPYDSDVSGFELFFSLETQDAATIG